ncbi:SusC/RagA family TonB-linked outer membrane protein [Pseudoflavitalea sp. G-6-1-2]|uniref:SusC/RagA family TonB-linked outer membrane protein n=1 Tax=Pseudoflavitalea sp. G-6-1-2 TaxID=2728841 RepID=UPI00146B4390|nr:SusC/RagA family TonB-linked outer membrane protein [Pseudoflavitalea sp. G-6-1-2]NML22326.1 SusC/RagA family TonB-linked outer membrane protein [Pseudoflavitalea sp. G-6-1-2]
MKQMYRYLQPISLLLLLLVTQLAMAQEKQPAVKGIVSNPKGEPLEGVSVMVQGKGESNPFSASTQTNDKGLFVFNVLPEGGPYAFTFTYVGHEKKVLSGYQYRKNEMITIAVKLQPAASSMNDVVVVGYGTQKKVNLTGAVDQVSGDVFDNRSVPNSSQGLQGVLPNLNIIMGDGKPIQSPSFNIRGNTSIGQQGSALVLIDGVEGDPAMLNPADIASVTVLKDAASAAIYGARGVFGVVLITTRNASKDKTSVTYSANYSIKQPTTVPDFVTDGYTFAKMFNESWTAWNDYSQTPQNVNKTVKFSPAYLAEFERRSKDPSLPKTEVGANGEYVYYESTDWYKELYKNRNSSMEHNVAFSGSSGKSSFMVTGRYFGQEGLFRYNSDDYKMYNFRAKGSIQLYPWLTIDNNTDYSNMTYHNPLNVGEGGGIWRNIGDEGHNMAPMFNPDGTLTYSAAYTVGDFWYGKNGIDMTRRVIRNTSGFTASFLNNKLRIKGDFTVRNTDNNEKRTRVPVPYSRKPGVIEYVGTNTNDLQETTRETQYLASNIYAEYETKIKRDHWLKAMVGYNYEQSTYKMVEANRNDLINRDAQDINLALGQSITTKGEYERWAINGGFFRVNYGFKDRYLLEVNGRYDGSSKFPSNERYAFFPSISAGWRLSNENFWNVPRTIITDVKIRASYGSLGNGNIRPYSFLEQLRIEQSGRVLNGVRPQKTGQPGVIPDGLTWETATTQNLGLDMAFLSGRLSFSGDAYIRNTKDMFTLGMPLPNVFGTDVPKGNYADLRTKGWEISLAWRDKFNVASKPLSYQIRVILSDYQSEVTRFNNPDKKLTGTDNYYEGQKLGEIWGFVTEGYFTEKNIGDAKYMKLYKGSTSGQFKPGDIKFKDLDGNDTINTGANTVFNPGDRKVIGNSTPRYSFGINIDLDWNGFFFSTFFQGVGRQDWWPGKEAATFWGQYNRPYNKIPKWQLGNIWSEENPEAYLPRYRGYSAQSGGATLAEPQTKYLQNVAYIRMKNIQVGYNLPAKLIGRIGMSSARFYVSGENLWSWSPFYRITRDLDIENTTESDRVLTDGRNGNGNNYPMLKSVTFGLSVTF